jgi:sialic acid synthase SpsE
VWERSSVWSDAGWRCAPHGDCLLSVSAEGFALRTFVIAEAGVNHNGSEELALALVECAARAGADAVKFQTFHADDLVTPEARKADYQTRATGEGNQHEMLRALELSGDMHQTLFERCRALGIEFMSTPFDEAAADFLVNLGVKRLKVPSGELTNIPFLEHLAGKGIPLIVSTGMGTLDEVRRAVETIEATRLRCGFALPLSQCLTLPSPEKRTCRWVTPTTRWVPPPRRRPLRWVPWLSKSTLRSIERCQARTMGRLCCPTNCSA